MNVPVSQFITVEGTEGAGKSTCIEHIQQWALQNEIPLVCTREPGGTPLAEQIRDILLEARDEQVDGLAELLLVFAARAQHLNGWILPNIKAGKWVLSDRFTDATYAYQGAGRGLSTDQIVALETLVQGGFQPALTLLLDLPVEVGLERARQRSEPDRFELEQQEFFEKVRAGYRERAKQQPWRVKIIDASKAPEQVAEQLVEALDQWLASLR
ncbi:MAG: dTMP kinase [Pseudomonadales bacterium]|nr:dTMP kinase [Pseudomonadales bacterium]